MDQNAYRKLVSGESTGPGAALLRFLLAIGATIYGLIIGLRNFLYSKEWLKIHKADVPVISIGNITTGGTGKTPLVIRLCNLLISIPQFKLTSSQCAILTRGYKAAKHSGCKSGGYGDEPAVLAQGCPGIQVVVNPDRIAGAAEAISRFGAKVLIMDDGFQHRRLCRDLDIVSIDATIPFGYGRLLPAGLLREPVTALKRADAAVITRCAQVCEAELTQLEAKLGQVNPEMVIARSVHAPVCAKSVDDREISLEELKNKRIFAFCGIGNPDAFFNTVVGLGAELAGSKVFDDHYHYSDDCIADIYEQAKGQDADLILTTQKDWSSFSSSAMTNASMDINFAYLAIEFRFISGEDKITQLIINTLSVRI
ncbi:MAG: tetraacyldisaccharide 4'-kinase [Phycisphaerae bacterium]|nr:tetraacyldisaccharide 4'-kinase [Phycisphaerae bacterium]NIP50605.1 tetraacyldisaccharide 4'-kinase [Phycisphaerae bacterium]NIS49741.1 tetraacyldisaccharide 4'-kinase [Phycisphaerae bacterium]NIU07493.1 tetraacyldisaccharide 4'-kinase [Phycisphaerae bacterium]NIU55083.1 tetraacyldisaccharide 4'-kinase [Phycisphaerae bacterium]